MACMVTDTAELLQHELDEDDGAELGEEFNEKAPLRDKVGDPPRALTNESIPPPAPVFHIISINTLNDNITGRNNRRIATCMGSTLG